MDGEGRAHSFYFSFLKVYLECIMGCGEFTSESCEQNQPSIHVYSFDACACMWGFLVGLQIGPGIALYRSQFYKLLHDSLSELILLSVYTDIYSNSHPRRQIAGPFEGREGGLCDSVFSDVLIDATIKIVFACYMQCLRWIAHAHSILAAGL
jgi:hypothetical protein